MLKHKKMMAKKKNEEAEKKKKSSAKETQIEKDQEQHPIRITERMPNDDMSNRGSTRCRMMPAEKRDYEKYEHKQQNRRRSNARNLY